MLFVAPACCIAAFAVTSLLSLSPVVVDAVDVVLGCVVSRCRLVFVSVVVELC